MREGRKGERGRPHPRAPTSTSTPAPATCFHLLFCRLQVGGAATSTVAAASAAGGGGSGATSSSVGGCSVIQQDSLAVEHPYDALLGVGAPYLQLLLRSDAVGAGGSRVSLRSMRDYVGLEDAEDATREDGGRRGGCPRPPHCLPCVRVPSAAYPPLPTTNTFSPPTATHT